MDDDEDYILSMSQAGKNTNVCKMAIHKAIIKKRLQARFIRGRWRIKPQDLEDYRTSRYNRKNTVRDGKPVYSVEEGRFTPSQAAKKLGLKTQRVYYLIRRGEINYYMSGGLYVITLDDIKDFNGSYKNIIEGDNGSNHFNNS